MKNIKKKKYHTHRERERERELTDEERTVSSCCNPQIWASGVAEWVSQIFHQPANPFSPKID
jgi:hypothetical protein